MSALSRRRLLAASSAGIAALLASSQVRLVAAQDASPESAPIVDTLTGDPDAVAALRTAAQAMADLQSFTFRIETTRGSSTVFQGLDVNEVNGAVRRPLDFTATVSVSLPIGEIDVTAVGIDGRIWVQDPLSDGTQWIELEASEGIAAFVNPDILILSSIGLIQDAAFDEDDQLDGAPVRVVSGTIDFEATAEQLSGDQIALPAEISGEPLDVWIYVDEQNRVREVELLGPILTSESDDVARVVSFSGFDEPVEIQAPPV